MSGFMGLARRIARNEDGATAIEYAFLAALIATAIVSALIEIGAEVNTTFVDVAEGFPTAEE